MQVPSLEETIVRWAAWASSVGPVSPAEREAAQEAVGLEVELFGSPTALINVLFERRCRDVRLRAYPLAGGRWSDAYPTTEMARSVHKDVLQALEGLLPQPDIAPWYSHCDSGTRSDSQLAAVDGVLWEMEERGRSWYAGDLPWRLILLDVARGRGLLRNESLPWLDAIFNLTPMLAVDEHAKTLLVCDRPQRMSRSEVRWRDGSAILFGGHVNSD